MSATLWLAFARTAGFVARAPGLRTNVPASARACFAFALALAIAPSLPPVPPASAVAVAAAAASEALLGALLGFAASIVAESVSAAGRLLDDIVGLRASVPGISLAPAGFGGLWSLVFVAAFFAVGGVETTVWGFSRSFAIVPLAAAIDPATLQRFGPRAATELCRLALDLAAPPIGVALLVHLALAALGRVVPRFGNLTLAFPAAYGGVLLAAFAGLAALRGLGANPLAAASALLLR